MLRMDNGLHNSRFRVNEVLPFVLERYIETYRETRKDKHS
jgi:hypothetical protein